MMRRWSRLMRFVQRGRRDTELAREIAHYLAQETADNIARGMTDAQARHAALRKFGNPTSVREAVYHMNTFHPVDTVAQDVRYAIRQLRLRPGFAIATILSLALGIGANTAIFTLVDQILLRLLPVKDPHELVLLRADGPRPGGNWGDSTRTFPYPTYVALRDRNTVFAGLTGQRVEAVTLIDDARSALISVGLVAGNYFEVLGVRPYLGRLLQADDDRTLNAHPVAVLQFDFWQAQYHGRRDIVGQAIRLNGAPFTVIGVAAPGFEGTNVGTPTKVFVPVTMQPTIAPTNVPPLAEERAAWFYLLARLKPGVSIEAAEAAMKVLYRQRQEEELSQSYFARFPETRAGYLQHRLTLVPAERGDSALRVRFEQPLIVLASLAAAVLLIACANIAGLLLARGAARQRDLAIRRAIGASRGRIIAQLVAESLMLAAVGAVAAVFLGGWLTQLLVALLPNGDSLSLSTAPDGRILAFTAAIAALAVLLFGLLPAWQNSGVAPVATLREDSRAIASGGMHVRMRKFFVGLQVALSAVLLLGAGLFVRSLVNLRHVELGVQSENVVTFVVRPAVPFDTAHKLQGYRALLEGLARVPGVVAVGGNRNALFTGGRNDGPFTIEGAPPDPSVAPFTFYNAVSPGYFAALGIPIKAGADFTWRDWGSGKRLAVVNETLLRTVFNGTPPLGRRIGQGSRSQPNTEIVGVFGDARYHEVRGELPPQTFLNLDSVLDGISRVNIYAKTTGNLRLVMPALRAEVHRIDPNFIVADMRTLDAQINTRLSNERLLSFLSIGFAFLATVLAVVGLHGVLAFQVTKRTREIGIRMALGATRGEILGLVAREMIAVVLTGLVAGMIAAYAAGRYVQSQLFGLAADDPLVFGMAAVTLVGAAAVAMLAPALRAARIDPMHALRYE